MLIDVPNKTPWRQLNKGDFEGSVWSTRNIDFKTKRGYALPTQKLIVTTLSGVSDSPTDLAVGFCKATGTFGGSNIMRWWTVAGTSVYVTGTSSNDFDEDDSGSLPTTAGKEQVDIKAFNNKIYVAYDDTLYRRQSSTYTLISSSLDASKKLMDVYGDRLYIASDTKIDSMDTSEALATTAYTLDLSIASNERLTISCMRKVSNGIWIGTYNNNGGRAKMMFWDGITEDTVETIKEVESGMIMAMSIKDDIPYILDNRGVLSAYNGSYFEEVDRLDFNFKQFYRFDEFGANDRWIHPNGMQTIDDEILMNICTRMEDTTDDQVPRTPSGIYAYNSEFGIYHKYSHTSQQDNTTVVDQGQLEIAEAGAIYSMVDDEENNERDEQSDFFVTYAYKSDNSTTKYVIAKSDKRGLDMDTANPEEAGVIIMSKISAELIQEQWKQICAFIRPFQNTTDKIVLKYRKQEYIPVETNITWVDTTSFTSTDSDWATILTNFDAEVDYEVEGLQGDGAGFISHITDISESGGTYTVTLDETITGATTNTAKVRVDRWVKLGEFTGSEVEDYKVFSPEISSSWIQFKIYMIGDGIQLQRFLSDSDKDQAI